MSTDYFHLFGEEASAELAASVPVPKSTSAFVSPISVPNMGLGSTRDANGEEEEDEDEEEGEEAEEDEDVILDGSPKWDGFNSQELLRSATNTLPIWMLETVLWANQISPSGPRSPPSAD